MSITKRQLGSTDITISPIGLGCWQFSQGAGMVGSYWATLDQRQMNEIVAASLHAGVSWFDTAEAYGNGKSEQGLSRALEAAGSEPGSVVVATKWFPAFRFASNIGKTIGARKAALSPYPIDLYQVHHPFSFSSVAAQMQAMAQLVERGDVRAVGVSNFSAEAMRAAHAVLTRHGVVLASNQVRYSLLDRQIESNGVLETARELGVSIIAYSPLAQGILTGKFHEDPELIRSRPGPRKWLGRFKQSGLEETRPLIESLRRIAADHEATPAQIALAWTVREPLVVAIPGATKVEHAQSNTGAMAVTLTAGDIAQLDSLA